LTAVGLDEEDNQKHSRNQDKQQAGHKAEIIGFHGWIGNGVKVSLLPRILDGAFIGRCGWAVRSGLLALTTGRLHNGVWPGQRARREGFLEGLFPGGFPIGEASLGAGEHHQGALHKALTGQSPTLGPAAELLDLYRSQGAERVGLGASDVHKTGDALAAAAAVSKLALQAIKLNPFPKGHLSEIFPGVALHILSFSQETNHWHGPSRNPDILKLRQLRSVT
jgi:hypothetical protein